MKSARRLVCLLPAFLLAVAAAVPAPAPPAYVQKATRVDTILASLKASGLPPLEGTWHYIGPFDNRDGHGFNTAYPPEREIDLKKTYPGKNGQTAAWKEFPHFRVGHLNDLKRFRTN